jgi:hypothetical protein
MSRLQKKTIGIRVMVFNKTFNNISVILWWSVLLFEETRVLGENHRPARKTINQVFISKIGDFQDLSTSRLKKRSTEH